MFGLQQNAILASKGILSPTLHFTVGSRLRSHTTKWHQGTLEVIRIIAKRFRRQAQGHSRILLFLQALGSLVQGNNSESFLSMVAVEKVFGVLQASVGATQAIQREAIFAFLEKCLFSYPAWEALSSSGALPENSSIIPDQLLLTQLVFSEAHSEVLSFPAL